MTFNWKLVGSNLVGFGQWFLSKRIPRLHVRRGFWCDTLNLTYYIEMLPLPVTVASEKKICWDPCNVILVATQPVTLVELSHQEQNFSWFADHQSEMSFWRIACFFAILRVYSPQWSPIPTHKCDRMDDPNLKREVTPLQKLHWVSRSFDYNDFVRLWHKDPCHLRVVIHDVVTKIPFFVFRLN